MLKLSNEKAKWESIKCQGPRYLYADFIGENSKKTYKDCNTKEGKKQIDDALDPYHQRQNKINLDLINRRLGVKTGAKREFPTGNPSPAPTHPHRTHDTTDQWRDPF